jgi:hypothetical protein
MITSKRDILGTLIGSKKLFGAITNEITIINTNIKFWLVALLFLLVNNIGLL